MPFTWIRIGKMRVINRLENMTTDYVKSLCDAKRDGENQPEDQQISDQSNFPGSHDTHFTAVGPIAQNANEVDAALNSRPCDAGVTMWNSCIGLPAGSRKSIAINRAPSARFRIGSPQMRSVLCNGGGRLSRQPNLKFVHAVSLR